MSFSLHLIRPDDLLNLRIETENLVIDPAPEAGAVASLVVANTDMPALLRVIFPPQHIAEEAVFEAAPTPIDAESDPDRKPRGETQPGAPAIGNLPKQPGAFRARIAQPSRLVFEVPAGHRIPLTIAGLLDWDALITHLHPLAAIQAVPNLEERRNASPLSVPLATHTALELPFRLLISPGQGTVWLHRAQLQSVAGRTELWHTRLALRGDTAPRELDFLTTAPLRALWSTDPAGDQNQISETPGIGLTALSPDDRRQVVILSSAFHGYETRPDRATKRFVSIGAFGQAHLAPDSLRIFIGSAPYEPKPFYASQLMLSPLGGWLKSRGLWDPPRPAAPVRFLQFTELVLTPTFAAVLARAPVRTARTQPIDLLDALNVNAVRPSAQDATPLDLSEWTHVATQGRDHYVRIVYEGELWPFRHRAALVKVTERKFRVDGDSGIVVAYLVQRVFIVVREPVKKLGGRDNPLTQVRLTTLVTPDLTKPRIDTTEFKRTFWVELGAAGAEQAFAFHATGTDQAGREVDFIQPMVFASIVDVDGKINNIADFYNGATPSAMAPPPANRNAGFSGRKLAYTELPGNSENPLLATDSLLFVAKQNGAPPSLGEARVRIPALAELIGKNDPIAIVYESVYVTRGYADTANRTGVFARLVTPLRLDFNASQAGGIATPNQRITALSLAQGPVAGDIAKALNDTFEPGDYFPSTLPNLPQLFGTFGLGQLLEKGSLSGQAPRIATQRLPDRIVTTLDWQPQVSSHRTVGVADFVKNEPRKLVITGRIETPFAGSAPTSEFSGALDDFKVTLLDSVVIQFKHFRFTSRNGEKPNVDVALDTAQPLIFSGDLEFVDDLRHAIPPGLFGKGASLEVTGAAIRAGFAIALPPLEIGVFALKDVSLGAALTLPFLDGKPLFDFNVSERANPFQLRVAFFAGGGFFRLQMDTKGMRQLEAALEFGAAFGLNLGVASGEVHAMAGIYFAIQHIDNKDLCQLTGYLRLGGRLSVLAIIRVSIEFNLSFTYNSATQKAYGRATLTVMVEVLLFSASVDLTVERAFGGSGDPLFLQTFDTAERWQTYADAFA